MLLCHCRMVVDSGSPISIHGPPAGPPQPPEFWEIPSTGQASLLYSFVNPESFGFRNLSPNGENIVYVKSKADQSSQICLHKNGNALMIAGSSKGKMVLLSIGLQIVSTLSLLTIAKKTN